MSTKQEWIASAADMEAQRDVLANWQRNALKEIERLQADRDKWRQAANQWEQTAKVQREYTIEECARVADGFGYNMDIAKMLAAAIRALKNKP